MPFYADRMKVSPHRIEALSDGIFAIAMTLLVLELELPKSHDANAYDALHEFWPDFAAYAASFAVLGVYWVAQHMQFHFIRRVDQGLIWLNLLFLMLVAGVPFSASLIGHLHFARWAVVFYGVHLVCISAVHHFAWVHATTRRLLGPEAEPNVVRAIGRFSSVQIGVYLVAIALAFVNAYVSVAIYAIVPVLYVASAVLRSETKPDSCPREA